MTHHLRCAVVETLSTNHSTQHAAAPELTTANGIYVAVGDFRTNLSIMRVVEPKHTTANGISAAVDEFRTDLSIQRVAEAKPTIAVGTDVAMADSVKCASLHFSSID